MPLFKRKPFPLLEAPDGLDPHALVFQVRFTNEIFKDYQEYLNRINLYRQRIWTCKVTGKTNLTYEEALVSEQHAAEKLQQFPKELVSSVLHMIQFSTLGLKDLVNMICMKLQGYTLEGDELYGKKEKSVCPCKILKVLDDVDKICYEVGWLDKDKKVIGSAVIDADDLIRKKLPFSRDVLKSFIRDSTSQSTPWIVHEKLARKHGVLTEPPEELLDNEVKRKNYKARKNILDAKEGEIGKNKRKKLETEKLARKHGVLTEPPEELLDNEVKRKNYKARKNILDAKEGEIGKNKRKKLETENYEGLPRIKKAKEETEKSKEESIKYPIDDLLVKPGGDDPVFSDRPSPSRDFNVPMDCAGDLLMVWDFCSSFSRLLHLWPFSLEDFENAICHKGSNLILIVESHSAILRLLMKEKGEYFTTIQKKRKKSKITLVNWTEYLCDFLEMGPELSSCIATIKRGHYGLLDTHTKLGIFRELVAEALATDAIREHLDEYIKRHQALAAKRREEALGEARKRREEKELLKAESVQKELMGGQILENGKGNLHISENGCNKVQNRDAPVERDENVSPTRSHVSESREGKKVNTASRKVGMKKILDVKVAAENGTEPSMKECKRITEAQDNKSKEQKNEYLEREMEKGFICNHLLGKDRNYNRYWFFNCDGRIFVESSDSQQWGYYSVKEELDALMGSLNCKGERERALQGQLEKYYRKICTALQKKSKDIAYKKAMKDAILRRSMRVRAQPRDNLTVAFLKYVNKWKED